MMCWDEVILVSHVCERKWNWETTTQISIYNAKIIYLDNETHVTCSFFWKKKYKKEEI